MLAQVLLAFHGLYHILHAGQLHERLSRTEGISVAGHRHVLGQLIGMHAFRCTRCDRCGIRAWMPDCRAQGGLRPRLTCIQAGTC